MFLLWVLVPLCQMMGHWFCPSGKSMILYKIDPEKLTWWPDLPNCSTAPSHHSGSISGHHQALCCQSSTPSPCNCRRFGDICHSRGDICRSPFHDPGAADRPSSHATSGHTALVLSRCSSRHGGRLGRRDQRRGWRKLLCHKQRCSAKNSQQNVKVLFTILWLLSQKKPCESTWKLRHLKVLPKRPIFLTFCIIYHLYRRRLVKGNILRKVFSDLLHNELWSP